MQDHSLEQHRNKKAFVSCPFKHLKCRQGKRRGINKTSQKKEPSAPRAPEEKQEMGTSLGAQGAQSSALILALCKCQGQSHLHPEERCTQQDNLISILKNDAHSSRECTGILPWLGKKRVKRWDESPTPFSAVVILFHRFIYYRITRLED